MAKGRREKDIDYYINLKDLPEEGGRGLGEEKTVERSQEGCMVSKRR